MTRRPSHRRFAPATAAAAAAAAGCLLTAALAVAPPFANAAPGPTPTPTPRPRLSGGFGRTPVPGVAGDGQSMADVVRAAGAPRDKKEKGLAITNESLVKDPNKGRLSTSSPPKPSPAAASAASPRTTPQAQPLFPGVPTASPSTSTSAVPTPGAPVLSTAQEAEWRDRAHRARQRVEELRAQITTLEADTKQLETDFYRWDDGQYRDRVIKPSWDKKREELETAKRQLTAAEADLADLPEQARKAGALPGWLRE